MQGSGVPISEPQQDYLESGYEKEVSLDRESSDQSWSS